MLARFLAWHAADGRELVAVEVEFDADRRPGAASAGGSTGSSATPTGRLVVVDLKTGQDRRPRTTRGAPAAGAYQLAVAAGGVRRARQRAGRRGAGAARHGRQGARSSTRSRCPATCRRTGLGRRAGRRGAARAWAAATSRCAPARHCDALPGPAQLPAAASRPAGDRMSAVPDRRTAVLRRPARRAAPSAGRRRARLLDPAEVAARCGLPTRRRRSRPRVIAAPLDRPLVVVAGAGSGKTETMAARVVWLVANRLVEPGGDPRPDLHPQGRRRARRADPAAARRARPRTRTPTRTCASGSHVAEPTVSTYHAYAGRLVAEHGLRLGVEPGARLLSQAMCWSRPPTRRRRAWTGDMSDVPLDLLTTVEDVLALAGELAEHHVEPGGAARLDRPAARRGSPATPTPRARRARTRTVLRRCSTGSAPGWRCCRWSRRSRRASGRAGAIDFADQIALAARIAVGSRRGRPPASGPAGGSCCSTSTRTPRRPAAHARGAVRRRHRPPGDRRRRPVPVDLRLARRHGRHHRALRRAPSRAGPARRAERLTLATSWRNDRASSPSPTRVGAMLPDARRAAARPRPGADRRAAGAVTRRPATTRSPRRPRRWPTGSPRCWRGDGPGVPARRPAAAPSPCWSGPASSSPASPPRCASAACRSRWSGSAGCSPRPEVVRRRRHAAGAGRPDRRRRARPAAHRRPLADRAARPRRAGAARPGAGRAPAGPAPRRRGRRRAAERRAERGSLVEALDDLGGPDAYSADGLPPAAARLAAELRGCAAG